ncbi:MAG: type II toxin-antitoxin system Phd/YefM family antitoxin [Phascolarctobacterium sp.]|nr:type II toxin-antitoxin system Phd/YefM family antitoxin [Phascolarctobacterium sp.]
MKIATQNLVSISEANQNFSRVARMVDEMGSVVVLKNNTPKYIIIEFKDVEDAYASDEDILNISKDLMLKNKEAYEVLAK